MYGPPRAVLSGAAAACLATGVAAGPDWEEGSLGSGDAGRLPSDAQVPQGPPLGDLDSITGALDGLDGPGPLGDFQDMYAIWILTPTIFSASTDTADGGMSTFDTQLWLFDAAGFGLLGVDGLGAAAAMGNASTDGTGIVIDTPGLYYLAISIDTDSLNADGAPLFDQAVPGEVSGPDGPGGFSPVADWSAAAVLTGGDYRIALGGTAIIPAPTTAAALLLGLAAQRRRRRG